MRWSTWRFRRYPTSSTGWRRALPATSNPSRVQSGRLSAKQIWGDMVREMPQGEPTKDDHGLNNTHTWGRTYWGGAMFCLVRISRSARRRAIKRVSKTHCAPLSLQVERSIKRRRCSRRCRLETEQPVRASLRICNELGYISGDEQSVSPSLRYG